MENPVRTIEFVCEDEALTTRGLLSGVRCLRKIELAREQ